MFKKERLLWKTDVMYKTSVYAMIVAQKYDMKKHKQKDFNFTTLQINALENDTITCIETIAENLQRVQKQFYVVNQSF